MTDFLSSSFEVVPKLIVHLHAKKLVVATPLP